MEEAEYRKRYLELLLAVWPEEHLRVLAALQPARAHELAVQTAAGYHAEDLRALRGHVLEARSAAYVLAHAHDRDTRPPESVLELARTWKP